MQPPSAPADASRPAPEPVPAWTAPYRLAVALRLLRARKINFISILGVMLGVGSIIVVMAVMDGFQLELRTMIRGTLSDVMVEVDPAVLADYDDLRARLEALDGVQAVTQQRHNFGAIPSRRHDMLVDGGRQKYLPVRIVGILPEDEARVSRVIENMQRPGDPEGDPFELVPRTEDEWFPEEDPRVAISEWMAKRLGGPGGVRPGDRITLITLEGADVANGGAEQYRTNSRDAWVSRIYKSGNSEFDKLHVYVDLAGNGRVFFPHVEGVVAELRIKLDRYQDVERMRERIARTVGFFDPDVARFPEYYTQTWEQRQHNLLRAVNNEKFLLAFVLFFIVLVACFSIFATLTMTVVEKTRDIGVLRALGATPGGILSIFVLNGTLVGAIGASLGYGAGLLVAHNVNPIRAFLRDRFGWDIFPAEIYLFDTIPTFIDHRAALLFTIGALASAFVFAIIPSIRAARLRPVSALRYE